MQSCQKAAQRTTQQLQDLLEVCCLWHRLEPDLKSYLGPGQEFQKVQEMWQQGRLGSDSQTWQLPHKSRKIWQALGSPDRRVVFKNRATLLRKKVGRDFGGVRLTCQKSLLNFWQGRSSVEFKNRATFEPRFQTSIYPLF